MNSQLRTQRFSNKQKTPRIYRLFRIMILGSLAGALLWALTLMKDPNFMPIRDVQIVTSYQHLDQKNLAAIISPYVTEEGLFSIDVQDLKQSLLQIPWVYNAIIKRVWPDKIVINVIEQTPVAVWNGSALLNAEAEIYSPPMRTFPTGLPQLKGPEGEQELVLQQYQEMTATLQPLGLTISEIDLNMRHSWTVLLNNGMQIILGRNDTALRLARFISVYPKIIKPHEQIGSVDLRYGDGLAVSWRPSSALTKSNN